MLHVDLYRIDGPEEYLPLALDEEMDGRTVIVVEWPERAAAALPDRASRIRIDLQHDARVLQVDESLLPARID